jgi:arylformamidase
MQIIDLTEPIREDMVLNHPNHPRAPVIWQYQRHVFSQWLMGSRWDPPRVPRLYDGLPPEAGMPGKGHGVQSQQLLISTHMGTHIDAARHFDHRQEALDAASLPLEACSGEAVMLDLSDVCVEKHAITLEDLSRAEQRMGDQVKERDIVILHTGHSAKYGYGPNADVEKYASRAPGLGHDTPIWFIDRKVKLVGIDTANLDCDYAGTAHINFLLRGWIGKDLILVVENLVNLERIPRPRFTFFALPLPIVGGDGSPVRAVAILP